MNNKYPSPNNLAVEFSRILNNWLTKQDIESINEANKKDPNFCASHDYCDPNEAMLEAYENISGSTPVGFLATALLSLFREAWAIAKLSQFSINLETINSTVVYGTICNDRSGQVLNAMLPSGQVYDISGELTTNLDTDYTTTVTDEDGSEVTIVAKWEK